jgi:hypothetical protein
MDQLKGFGQPLVLANKRTCPPSLFDFITLITITYQFSLLLFVCFRLPFAGLHPTLTYPSPLHLYCTGVGLPTYVILSFLFHSTVAPIILLCSKVFLFTAFVFSSPLGLVTHFSLFSTLFTFLTSFSHLASLPACCCFCVGLWPLRNLNCLGLDQLKLKLV